MGKVSKVELLGSELPLTFVQDDKGLLQPMPQITDQSLSLEWRVLHITHDKRWINDDDSGSKAPGWLRKCNLGTGDFNNDLTISNTPGDIWTCSFTGNNIWVIAQNEAGAEKIEIQIDGNPRAIAELSITGKRQAQEVMFEISRLKPGKYTISIVNRGSESVAVDALIVR